jgi:regulator of protease activity HflC (stomatin/prohibitin superfamily)
MQGQNEDNTLIGAINKAIDEAAKKYVLIDNVVVTRIKVPDYVQASIQKKIEQQQVDEALEFRLDQSRKEIAIATNEAQRNNTVKASLSPDLLKLRGIEATEKLAASPNTKVVIVGNGANSLPVILGSDK